MTSALPSQYSNQIQWRFTFECIDLTPCATECSIHQAGSSPNFTRCEREWSASGFRNQEMLEFSLRGQDDAGNVASPMIHQWTIGNENHSKLLHSIKIMLSQLQCVRIAIINFM